MTAEKTKGKVRINSEGDIVTVRKTVRDLAARLGFGLTDVTRIVTASSELARNIFCFAGSGTMNWRVIESNSNMAIELVFEDRGPGIGDIGQAMQEGFTTGGGLGMGLPGVKRLMDDFEINSREGKGTIVRTAKWIKK